MILLHKAYGIGEPVREGVPFLRAPQGVMFEKLVGGLFGAAESIPWDLVAWGAGIGVLAILVDRFFLAPRNSRFRLYAMPLAVGMYLPWTATVPIMVGGGLYLLVERRSLARGDDPEAHAATIHRGLLYSSGLVAGEAIMGIVIAGLVVANLPLPWLAGWQGGGAVVDLVSLAGLGLVMALLARKALVGRGSAD
jgi:putative OPT family oligopeptide transporter